VSTRTSGFLKDIEICLKDTPNGIAGGYTHAYFPALAACCGFLEYMTGLHRGKLAKIGAPDIQQWAGDHLSKVNYTDDIVRVLFDGFRHSVAHRGIATGVWKDIATKHRPERRITWKLTELSAQPACQLIEEKCCLTKDPPWSSPYTHRIHISLRTLADDLADGATQFATKLRTSADLQAKFRRAMQTLYPT
jgi:hypothetical protein